MGFRYEHARLAGSNGEPLVLEGVTASGALRGMLLDMRIEQRFRNPGTTGLEVVYTFPLPWRAVLLGVDVRLGDRTLTGSVVEKAQAMRGYENAIAEGDAAVMLEANADSSYSLNLGNLAPNEECVITLRYAQLLQVEQGSLRLLIPTVIAPRYGDPVLDGGLQPHQVAAHDMRARYAFDLSLRLHGDLSRAPVGSPTHPIRVIAKPGLLNVALAAQGMLDRDFILTLDRMAGDAAVLCAPDSLEPDNHVVMASFCPVLPPRRNNSIAAAILVDCSGSMAGDSLRAAQAALHEVMGSMVAGDRFSLSRFGSQVEHRSRGMWPFNGATLASARQWADTLAADLGGTEMETALASTFALADGNAVDVLLITDGQISAIEGTLDTARRSGHRVFVVGIGSSVAEAHLRRLAQDSGGACEFIAPGEAAGPAIVRMFNRIRAASASALRIRWPDDAEPIWSTALPANCFEGDTLHVFGLLRGRPAGSVSLLGKVAEGDEMLEIGLAKMKDGVQDLPALSRMAAAARIHGTSGSDPRYDAGAFAVTYQLVTPHTNFLLVHERAEQDKARDMPALHSVAQMVPAGWGGVGSVHARASASHDLAFSRRDSTGSGSDSLRAPAVFRRRGSAGEVRSDMEMYDIPAFLRMSPVEHESKPHARVAPFDACDPAHWSGGGDGEGFTPVGFAAWLAGQPASAWPRTYAGLEHSGVPREVVAWLRRTAGSECEEGLVIATFCTMMSGMGPAGFPFTGGTAANESPQQEAPIGALSQRLRLAIAASGARCWPSPSPCRQQ